MKRRKVLVVAPMQKEASAVVSNLGGLLDGVCVTISGIGKVNAAAACVNHFLTQGKPNIVLNVGCAGALYDSAQPGDLVVSTSVGYWDVFCGRGYEIGQIQGEPPQYRTPRWLTGPAFGALSEHCTFARTLVGDIVTGDRFCTMREDVSRIIRDFPKAVAVDMESAAIGHVCHRHCVPFLSVRVISDTVALDRGADYERFWAQEPVTRFAYVRPLVEALLKLTERSR